MHSQFENELKAKQHKKSNIDIWNLKETLQHIFSFHFPFFLEHKTNKSFPQNGKIHWISKIIFNDFSLQKLNPMKM